MNSSMFQLTYSVALLTADTNVRVEVLRERTLSFNLRAEFEGSRPISVFLASDDVAAWGLKPKQ